MEWDKTKWKGCSMCNSEQPTWHLMNSIDKPAFCPNCGKPLSVVAWAELEQQIAACSQSDNLKQAITAVSQMDSQSKVGQGTYVVEECSELIKELMKDRRGKGSDVNIISEACDVLTTIYIFLTYYNISEDFVRDQILYKCNRALERYNKTGEI